ncbi:MAG: hypothetical protein WKF58_10520 [Ilumatobacteraceae bacterium]
MEAITERSGRLVAGAVRRYDGIRSAGVIPLALRATIAVAAAVALVAMSRAEWHQVDVFFWLAMIAGAGAVVLPGSAAPLTMIISILFTWLIHADGEVDGALVVVAVSIGVLHVVCALAASMPLAAAAGVDVLRPWFAPLAAIVLATAARCARGRRADRCRARRRLARDVAADRRHCRSGPVVGPPARRPAFDDSPLTPADDGALRS